jgi:hypothetical protein
MQSLNNCRNSNERLLGLRKLSIATNDRTLTVRGPLTIRRRGGRKLLLAPNGADITAARHAPRQQRHGQGDRPGVPLAGNV